MYLKVVSYFICIFIFFFQTELRSQNYNELDSLKKVFEEKSGEEKISALAELSYLYLNIDIDSAVNFAEAGIALAQEMNESQYEASFLKNLARTYFFRSDLETSLTYLFDALKIYENLLDTAGVINSYYGISITYLYRNEFELARSYAQSGLNLAQAQKDLERIAAFNDLIGDILLDKDQDYEGAIAYKIKAIEYYESIEYDFELCVSYYNIGNVYKAYKNYDEAEYYLKKALELANHINNFEVISASLNSIGEFYFIQKEFSKAREYLNQAIKNSQNSYQKFRLLSYKTLAQVDSAEGHFADAYENQIKYNALFDSLSNIANIEKIHELEKKYQNEKKQTQIEVLAKENEIQTLWRNSFIGAFVFAFILAVGLYNRYRYKSKTGKELERLNNQLEDELTQAARYIQSLLPPKLNEKVATDWRFIPSAHLGGDSFGYGFLDEDNFLFYLIDVSGHGVGAALLSTTVHNIIKAKSLRNTDFYNPAEVLINLNKNFNMEDHDNKYFALWYGVLNLSSLELTCASAFHPPAIGISNGDIIKFGNKEMMIGAFSDYEYNNLVYQLSEDEIIFLFSDGCFEIQSDSGASLEFENFLSILKSSLDKKDEALDYIHSNLSSLSNSNSFDDDFSIIKIELKTIHETQ